LRDLYEVVPRPVITALLETADERYCALLSNRKGVANTALVCQEVVDHLLTQHGDRFELFDQAPVERVVLHNGATTLRIGPSAVTAGRVVLCTNGFTDHVIEHDSDAPLATDVDPFVRGTVGYMVGHHRAGEAPPATATSYVRNLVIGTDGPYYYATRRPFERMGVPGMLTCIGGPEAELADLDDYDERAAVPREVMDQFDDVLRPLIDATRAPGLPYDYAWHGVMGYTASRVRLIGAEPRNPVLLYNLGCNGVGFLPSIYGGFRISQLLAGVPLDPSIFDPR
jgi:glycine/D-amino acid oxidase-like deaminating enzyme